MAVKYQLNLPLPIKVRLRITLALKRWNSHLDPAQVIIDLIPVSRISPVLPIKSAPPRPHSAHVPQGLSIRLIIEIRFILSYHPIHGCITTSRRSRWMNWWSAVLGAILLHCPHLITNIPHHVYHPSKLLLQNLNSKCDILKFWFSWGIVIVIGRFTCSRHLMLLQKQC